MNLKRFFLPGMVVCLALAGCAPKAPAANAATPLATLASPTSSPTASPTEEPVGSGVPAILFQHGSNELAVISPVTGAIFGQLDPIPLDSYYDYALSPDRHTLAVLSATELYLIGLPAWKFRKSDVGLDSWVNWMAYSADGRLLALASGGPEGILRIVDASSGQVAASGQAGFSIRGIKFTRDGHALMVYGPHLASSGIAANAGVSVGAPEAALFSASDLSRLWSVELNNVRDGTFPKKLETANTQDMYQPGAAWHFDPGVAWAPDQDLLYLVHGDEERLTRVDFKARRVKTVDIRPAVTWLDRLLALTAGVAYAKGMDGTTKQAVISPDGKYLYVVGSRESVTQQPNKQWNVQFTQLGLEVIQPEDGTLVSKLDTAATSAMLSPDGQELILSGWTQGSTYETPWTDVYDLSPIQRARHLDGMQLIPTRRLDGSALWGSSHLLSDIRCDMAAINPATWATSGNWSMVSCVNWLVEP